MNTCRLTFCIVATALLVVVLCGCSSVEQHRRQQAAEYPPRVDGINISPSRERWAVEHMPAEAKAKFVALHPGMTRAELDARFAWCDGLFSSMDGFRYILCGSDVPEGQVMAFEVDFRPSEMSSAIYANPARHARWLQQHRKLGNGEVRADDIVMAIRGPHVANISID